MLSHSQEEVVRRSRVIRSRIAKKNHQNVYTWNEGEIMGRPLPEK